MAARIITAIHNYPSARTEEIHERLVAMYGQLETGRVDLRTHALGDEDVFGTIQQQGPGDEFLFAGGSHVKFGQNPYLKDATLDFVRNLGAITPALGICFGAQAIGRAYGAELSKMATQRSGEYRVRLRQQCGALAAATTIVAFESHGWSFGQLPADLELYADSEDGVEAFVHDRLPAGGVQFHPEIHMDTTPDAMTAFGGLREVVLSR